MCLVDYLSAAYLRVGLVGDDEAQQELVHVLQVRPRGLERGLLLLRLELRPRAGRRQACHALQL